MTSAVFISVWSAFISSSGVFEGPQKKVPDNSWLENRQDTAPPSTDEGNGFMQSQRKSTPPKSNVNSETF